MIVSEVCGIKMFKGDDRLRTSPRVSEVPINTGLQSLFIREEMAIVANPPQDSLVSRERKGRGRSMSADKARWPRPVSKRSLLKWGGGEEEQLCQAWDILGHLGQGKGGKGGKGRKLWLQKPVHAPESKRQNSLLCDNYYGIDALAGQDSIIARTADSSPEENKSDDGKSHRSV
ncbi:hypothetical protein RRG08_060980 [Elysia crispata]|uniref:Uncharacterized protein n=1 Tax=Elysia crispata TaxID=231223 RepID=A0AAE1E5I3_9GAST|nr:hypothetical protein RRG08_060980 [Elysia crispata]